LDLANWPHLPATNLRTTQAADYMALLNSPPPGMQRVSPEAAL
jgi:hypothetical protein